MLVGQERVKYVLLSPKESKRDLTYTEHVIVSLIYKSVHSRDTCDQVTAIVVI